MDQPTLAKNILTQTYLTQAVANSSSSVLTGNVQDTTLGISDLALNNLVNVFPNPVNSVLHINSNKDINQVKIYDITGKEVLIKSNSLQEIDVSQLYDGLYFLNIEIDNQNIVKKIIIN